MLRIAIMYSEDTAEFDSFVIMTFVSDSEMSALYLSAKDLNFVHMFCA